MENNSKGHNNQTLFCFLSMCSNKFSHRLLAMIRISLSPFTFPCGICGRFFAVCRLPVAFLRKGPPRSEITRFFLVRLLCLIMSVINHQRQVKQKIDTIKNKSINRFVMLTYDILGKFLGFFLVHVVFRPSPMILQI